MTSHISHIQLIDPVRFHQVREGRRGGRRWRRGRASPAVVVVASASPQCYNVLEADVCLCGVVDAVGDRHHGDGGDGGAAGPVTAAH